MVEDMSIERVSDIIRYGPARAVQTRGGMQEGRYRNPLFPGVTKACAGADPG